jgi:NAD(P)-dependent dehydrogenase (short-subunit alcohol dehydrogenase family)
MAKLAEKVAIITGGAGGIGQETGALFAAEGAYVLLVDLNEETLRQAMAFMGSERVSYVVADVTQPDQVEQYVRIAGNCTGHVIPG